MARGSRPPRLVRGLGRRAGPEGAGSAQGAVRALKKSRESGDAAAVSASESVRLDVWLDVACVFPTRSQAKAAVEGGKVDVDGSRAKPHREVRAGNRITVTSARGDPRILIVRGVASRSIPKAEARKLYEDVTPPESPEVREARRLDRLLAGTPDAGRPDRRERRERRERKGWDGR